MVWVDNNWCSSCLRAWGQILTISGNSRWLSAAIFMDQCRRCWPSVMPTFRSHLVLACIYHWLRLTENKTGDPILHQLNSQQRRDIHPRLVQCWPTVYGGPTLYQSCVNVSCLMGLAYQRSSPRNRRDYPAWIRMACDPWSLRDCSVEGPACQPIISVHPPDPGSQIQNNTVHCTRTIQFTKIISSNFAAAVIDLRIGYQV